ncbi:MAG: Cys-tRNA(Pro) deacylase [Deltaproteobacteria bacterium HGW-Deltaproteobacteria-1]|nr:MAG: Cys-tRNA(Pro) deacylase [Deltaproteobacteria bacterium HGW-Deltaproteobacteria-1]
MSKEKIPTTPAILALKANNAVFTLHSYKYEDKGGTRDKEVSTKALARMLGVKSITPCKPETAHKHTGYMVGGTSPFGTRKPLTVCMEKTIADLPEIFINAGSRGLLAKMLPSELVRILEPREVSVAI